VGRSVLKHRAVPLTSLGTALPPFYKKPCPSWFTIKSVTLVHRQRLQLIHDPRAHLHQPMPVPQQLPEIPILWTRYPNLREVIFQHQPA
jgi:hypothetical protein